MTIVFLSLVALMLIAALAFVLTPLLRGGGAADDTQRKLKTLDQARSDGILTDAEYAAKRSQLGDVRKTNADTRGAFRTALLVTIVLPLAAIALYRYLGTPQALDPDVLAQHPQAQGNLSDLRAALAKLSDKLKQNPNDPGGWTLLGRTYRETQQYPESLEALRRARELVPDNPDVMIEYAETLGLSNPQRSFAGEPRELIAKALSLDPQNQNGLWLSGVADYQDKNYASAIATWNHLLTLLSADPGAIASLKKQIANAEALRDGKPLPADDNAPAGTDATATADAAAGADAGATQAATGDAHLTVNVAIDPKFQDKVSPDDTLFVYAKAASGPAMPLAIAKLTAAQLPATVTLTDEMGMLPGMKLSQFPQVIVGARISKSGTAAAKSGDLQTLSAPIPTTRSEPLSLTIDSVVP